MKNAAYSFRRLSSWLVMILLLGTIPLAGQGRFQLEIYGGFSWLDPRDLNLLPKAEEQYTGLLFVERYLGWDGYFINDFPRITTALPAGIRLKYRLSGKLAASVEAEGFWRTREETLSGSFTYATTWSLTEAKDYSPYRLGLQGISVMAGLHYGFRAGRNTELEVGAAAGWIRAEFDYRSTWTYTVELIDPEFTHFSEDGGTLEENGQGDGFAAKIMFRLNRALGRRFGIFVETSAVYSRLNSFRGSGRESRLGIPGETVWEGPWGVKREEIEVSWGSASILVPTNYWEGWVADQRERDFVLDLSSARLSAGLYVRF